MNERLLTAEVPVEELLSGHYAFSIPPFQRDYSWTRREALQLLDDIVGALDQAELEGRDAPYFLGTMLMVSAEGEGRGDASPEPDDQNAFAVDVIDGQQRLITLAILFAVLRDIAGTAADKERLHGLIAARTPSAYPFQLRLKGADETFFSSAILTPGAAKKSQPPAATGTDAGRRNIERNRHALHQRLLREFTAERRAKIAEFVQRQMRVLVATTSDFDYAYQIFLTINDRGKRLTVEDIFRGEILGPLDGDQRQRFSSIVEEMDRYTDAEEKSRGKGKTFFTHLAHAYAWTGKGIVAGLRRAVSQRGGPRRFAADVFAPMAEAYLAIKSGGASLPDGSVSAEVRHWLTVLSWHERCCDDDWVGVAMLGLSRLDRDGVELPRLLKAIDRFAHGLSALGCGRTVRQSFYRPALTALAAPDLPADPASLLRFPAKQEAMIVKSMATRLYVRDPQIARLVLIRLDAALSGRVLDHYAPLLDASLPTSERLTAEHVVPQGGVSAKSEWARLFPRAVRRAAIAQCIGNLVLVSEAMNLAAGQHDFAVKKQVYFNSGAPGPHPLMLTEALRDAEQWDAATVSARYHMLMEALSRLWSFDGPIPAFPAAGGEAEPS